MDPIELAIIAHLRAATQRGLTTALDLVPVQTGRLKESIAVVEPISSGGAANATIDFTIVAGNDTDVEYALAVELREPFLEPALGMVRSAIANEAIAIAQSSSTL